MGESDSHLPGLFLFLGSQDIDDEQITLENHLPPSTKSTSNPQTTTTPQTTTQLAVDEVQQLQTRKPVDLIRREAL